MRAHDWKKVISEEQREKSHTYGHIMQLFLESLFQHKENKQTQNQTFLQNLVVFSAATDLENNLFNTIQKRKKNLERTVIVTTGTYL